MSRSGAGKHIPPESEAFERPDYQWFVLCIQCAGETPKIYVFRHFSVR